MPNIYFKVTIEEKNRRSQNFLSLEHLSPFLGGAPTHQT